MGETDFSVSDIRFVLSSYFQLVDESELMLVSPHRRIVQQMGLDYRGDQYHLINRNCNHFSDALAKVGPD